MNAGGEDEPTMSSVSATFNDGVHLQLHTTVSHERSRACSYSLSAFRCGVDYCIDIVRRDLALLPDSRDFFAHRRRRACLM